MRIRIKLLGCEAWKGGDVTLFPPWPSLHCSSVLCDVRKCIAVQVLFDQQYITSRYSWGLLVGQS
jgi:hypothetical protein